MSTVPFGNAVVVMDKGSDIVNDSIFDAVCGVGAAASVTVIVTLDVPAAVAVPVIWPEAASMFKPAGRPMADHVYGVVPLVAVTGAL